MTDAGTLNVPGRVRSRTAGSGKAGSGKAGSGKAGSGKAGSGKVEPVGQRTARVDHGKRAQARYLQEEEAAS